MTIAQSFLNGIYTGKDATLTAYQVSKLEINKPCLARYNKFSDNGISFTVCDIASTLFTSKVSKAGAEKGISPVVVEAGEVLLFSINAQMKRDSQPAEDAGAIQSIAELLKGKNIKEGQIFFLSCDFGMIPPKGFDSETLAFLAQKKDSTLLQAHLFNGVDEFVFQATALGLNPEIWITALNALSGNEFKEMSGGYAKKVFSDLLEERIKYLEGCTLSEQNRILAAIGYPSLTPENQGLAWIDIATRILTSV